ncbi:MAG: lipopolysaccharide transport periplasmic protein LptA [Gammaproteobacteria bacterium]|jgi:lipopolysaccharide export system protein LptA
MRRDSTRLIWRVLRTLLLCLPLQAWGLSSDRDQPIHIESDKATFKEKAGISTYTGNVQLRQGTLIMHGDEMTVQLNEGRIEKIVLVGNPATYVQRPDGKDTDRHAQAEQIEYYTDNERLILIDAARIWQPGAEDFRSDRIVINLEQDTVNAGGGSTQDRVRITLPPKRRQEAGGDEPQ